MITTKAHNPRALLVWRVEQWLERCKSKGFEPEYVTVHPKDEDEIWTVLAQFPHLKVKLLGQNRIARAGWVNP